MQKSVLLFEWVVAVAMSDLRWDVLMLNITWGLVVGLGRAAVFTCSFGMFSAARRRL